MVPLAYLHADQRVHFFFLRFAGWKPAPRNKRTLFPRVYRQHVRKKKVIAPFLPSGAYAPCSPSRRGWSLHHRRRDVLPDVSAGNFFGSGGGGEEKRAGRKNKRKNVPLGRMERRVAVRRKAFMVSVGVSQGCLAPRECGQTKLQTTLTAVGKIT